MIFTRSIGAVSNFEMPPAAAPEIRRACVESLGGEAAPENCCRNDDFFLPSLADACTCTGAGAALLLLPSVAAAIEGLGGSTSALV